MSEPEQLRLKGRCPICEAPAVYEAKGTWLRDTLICTSCPGGSIPRERAIALAINRHTPNWRQMAIHESSPMDRGISRKLRKQCGNYTASHFFPEKPLGSKVGAYRNEDLEQQTFGDASFDLVVTIDVFEHVFAPDQALREIHRTLKPGGVYISAFPINKHLAEGMRRRANLNADGSIEHVLPAEYHGNPISAEGSLVTVDYGYDVHRLMSEWAPFDVQLTRFADASAGVLGEFTDVVVCVKR